ncbi:MAG: hypothetical protein CMA47_01285 [Euryarchaeota archaeon]|nr:hypothetical protein [Euryarchaeota archaeon]|tara:strand:+ start:2865 stop:3146 length:282 start_codon:yes stop_codon:yes gene_type:complete
MMSSDSTDSVGEFIQGESEPSSSWVVLALGLVLSLATLILHGILFPGRDLPVISDILPVFDGVFDSGIWFFILGVMLGVFAIIATMMTEATSE